MKASNIIRAAFVVLFGVMSVVALVGALHDKPNAIAEEKAATKGPRGANNPDDRFSPFVDMDGTIRLPKGYKQKWAHLGSWAAAKRPGEAIHEMGTARMGRDPRTSVLNAYNQAHDVPNLFVTDGACMSSSACQNPSLTYMALTARACAHAAEELASGAL